MPMYLGDFSVGATIPVPFHTFSSDDPSASMTITGLAVTDIEIYKNGNTTQRASDAGYTLLDTDGIDFDSLTGIHGISIDTSDDTTGGFFVAGADYWVVISSITLDGATINFVAAIFSIENRRVAGELISTTIATLATQTSFTLTVGSADDNAYNNCTIIVKDKASSIQKAIGLIQDYTGATKTVTLQEDPGIFTMAVGDSISIIATSALANVRSVHNTLQTANDNAADINTLITQVGTAGAGLTDLGGMSTGMKAEVNAEADTALTDYDPPTRAELTTDKDSIITEIDANETKIDTIDTNVDTLVTRLGTPANIDTGGATIADNLKKLADDNGGATFDATTDSLNEIRDNELTTIAGDVQNLDGDAMRGTDNAALASVLGALADAAADGDPTEVDTVMKYIKQLINILIGTTGIVAFPAEGAPANNISLAEVIRAIHADVTGLNGEAMRGTNSANTTVPDAAGTASGLHSTTDGKIDGLNDLSSSDVQTVIETNKLDHLVAVADSDDPVNDSIMAKLAATGGDWSTFVKGTDSLQAIRDRGDAEWTTGSGTGLTALATGTAQAGAAGTITLTAGASAVTDFHKGSRIALTGGTGSGQARMITAYNGTSKVATIAPNWATNPDATTTYEIQAADSSLGTIQNDAQSVTDLKDFADDGYDPSADKVQGVVLVDTTTTNTDMRGTDSANTTTPPTVSEIQAEMEENGASVLDTLNDLISDSKIAAQVKGMDDIDLSATMKLSVNAEADTALSDYDPPTRAELTTDKDSIITEIDANETKIDALPTAVSIADAVWDEESTGHVGAGKAGAQLWTDIDAILVDTGTTIPGTITTMQGNVTDILTDTGTTIPGTITTMQGNVTDILADTAELQGLISSSKIAAQVKGMDANVMTAAALAADAGTEIAAAVMGSVIDGSLTVTTGLTILLGLAIAKSVTKSDNVYTYKDQAGDTLITLTVGESSTTAVIA